MTKIKIGYAPTRRSIFSAPATLQFRDLIADRLRELEIDFVANMGSQRYYIQSAFRIPDVEKEKQEKEPLNNVDDSFKKIVLVRDVVKISRDEKGIVTMSIYDFLMDKNSLEK